jgi:hypothetical protein
LMYSPKLMAADAVSMKMNVVELALLGVSSMSLNFLKHIGQQEVDIDFTEWFLRGKALSTQWKQDAVILYPQYTDAENCPLRLTKDNALR